MNVELIKSFQFEAAHANPRGSDAARRLHGHSYRVEIAVRGECDPRLAWLIDYAEISERFSPCFNLLDHRLLNDVDGLADVSLPGVQEWIDRRLRLAIPLLSGVKVSIVGECEYRLKPVTRDEFLGAPERLAFGFEAAHYLPELPDSHKCRRMHGHSFRAEVGAGDLDRVAPILRVLYDELDHRCLNDIPGLDNPTSESLASWIWDRLSASIDDLACVVVAETCTARCVYRGG
ncbi:MAG: hypothetical protein AMXMBFR4_34660 [Candidatus Hydrogenedentota bacterium]